MNSPSRTRRRVVRIVAAIILTSPFTIQIELAGAQPQPISIDQYISLLEAAHSQATSGSLDTTSANMNGIRQTLGLPRVVIISDELVQMPQDLVLSTLQAASKDDFLAAAARLTVLLTSAREAAQVDALDRNRLQRSLSEAYSGVDSQLSPLQRLRRFAGSILAYFVLVIARAIEGASGTLRVIGWLAVVGFVVLVTFLGFKLLRLLGFVHDRSISQPFSPVAVTDWLEEAERVLALGDLGGAVRALFRALVQALSERGILADDPSLTAGECRAATAGIPSLDSQVAGATAVFELVTYGEVEPNLSDIEVLRAAEKAVRAA